MLIAIKVLSILDTCMTLTDKITADLVCVPSGYNVGLECVRHMAAVFHQRSQLHQEAACRFRRHGCRAVAKSGENRRS